MEKEKQVDLELTINQLKNLLDNKRDISKVLKQKEMASCKVNTVTYTAEITIRENKSAITNI